MNRATFIPGIRVILIAAAAFVGCDRNPLKVHVNVNRGSCLQAVQTGVIAVRKYAEVRGHLPEAGANLAEMGEFSVLPEIASMLQYGGNDSLSLRSPQRIIVLKCVSPISSPNGAPQFYCALLSGEVLLLQQGDATVGKSCPLGIGTVMLPKP